MSTLLQAGVQGGVIAASGWAVGIGGILLTALWLRHLYR
jgi:hypothetical protein